MSTNVKTIFKTAAVILFIDCFWLLTGGIFARQIIERIQGQPMSFRILGAAVVYLALAYMLLETTSYKQAFMYGIAIYAVYDFTNYAVFEHYDWKFGMADTLWGGVLFMAARYLMKNVV